MNVEVLSRIQFGLTISFHFLFPPMTIGLGVMLGSISDLSLNDRDWDGARRNFRLIRRGPTPSDSGEKGLVEKWQPFSLKGGRQTKG